MRNFLGRFLSSGKTQPPAAPAQPPPQESQDPPVTLEAVPEKPPLGQASPLGSGAAPARMPETGLRRQK